MIGITSNSLSLLVGRFEFSVLCQHKCGYIRDEFKPASLLCSFLLKPSSGELSVVKNPLSTSSQHIECGTSEVMSFLSFLGRFKLAVFHRSAQPNTLDIWLVNRCSGDIFFPQVYSRERYYGVTNPS